MAAYNDFLTLNNAGQIVQTGSADTTTVRGNLKVDQDLTVNGTLVTVNEETLLVQNSSIVLNQGYTTNSAKAGALVVNYLPTATTATVASGGFATTSTVVVANGVTYTAGQLIMVAGATTSSNDGIYEVASFNAGTDTITIDTTPSEGFSSNAFTVDTTVAGSVTVVTVSAMQAGTDGNWEVGKGSSTPISFSDLQTASGITVAADDVTTGNAAANFETTTGGVKVATLNNQALTLGSVGGNVTVNAATFDVNSNAATLDATTLSVDSTDTTNVTMTANAAGNKVLTISAVNSGSGEAQASITATDQLTVGDGTGTLVFDGGALSESGLTTVALTPSSAMTLTAGAASTWSTSSGALTLTSAAAATWSTGAGALTLTSAAAATWSTGAGILTLDGAGGLAIAGNSGEIDITTTGALDLNSGAGTWDASTLSLDSSDTTNLTMAANSSDPKVLTVAATNAGSGEAQASITATDQLTVGDGTGTLVFDGGALSETGLSSVALTPSGAITLTAGGASTWSTSAGALTLTSAAAATWSTSSGALTINGTNGVTLQEAGNIRFNITDAGAVAANAAAGQNINLQVNSVSKIKVNATADRVDFGASQNFTSAGANNTTYPAATSIILTNNTGSAIALGSAVAFDATTGQIVLADNASGAAGANTRTPVGVALGQINNGQNGPVAVGGIVPAKFAGNPGTAANTNGKVVYLSTGGLATMTAPTASGSTIFELGIAMGANNSDSTIRILWRPQFTANRP